MRDAPHVTEFATAYPLLSCEGYALMLWDTPGFGDSARLLRRLKLAQNPVGWLLSQVWDRFTDRPFWSTQQAARNVKNEADVVLYLVNAAEDPLDAGYVDLEMQLLEWTGKPVVVLLNQMGPPRAPAEEAAEQEKWARHFKSIATVHAVLPLDAFARCWVQEHALLDVIAAAIPASKKQAFETLSRAWRERNLDTFHRSMQVLTNQLAVTARDREALQSAAWSTRARNLLKRLGRGERGTPDEQAMTSLAERLDESIRRATDELIHLHGLSGEAAREVLQRLAGDYAVRKPVNEGFAAAVGGFFSGALSGLAADLATGGLSFGAAALGGGILGALGLGGLAKGFNVVRGQEGAAVRWSAEFLSASFGAALLRYLAVAHFGRGRGNYTRGEDPRIWHDEVEAVLQIHRAEIDALWSAPQHVKHDERNERNEGALEESIKRVMTRSAAELLNRLYPGSGVLAA